MTSTVSELAAQLRGELFGNGSTIITGFGAADSARPGDLTFADKEEYFAAALKSEATAILFSGFVPSGNVEDKPLIRVPNVRIAVARLLPLFFPPRQFGAMVHPSATIATSADVDPAAYIGPGCVIGERAKVGARSVLMGGNHIGDDCKIGEDVRLFPNVVIYPSCQIGNRVAIHSGTVIGSDGYGYVFDEGKHRKVLQVGHVIIQDDVEIGANAAIDRAALGVTVISQGTKIDNLVHIAHNVKVGKHCLIMGQVGFAGSTSTGDYCVIASQSGIAGHLKLGTQATVGAKSGVMRDIPDKGVVLGIPALPDKQTKRQVIALMQLPELLKRMRELEAQVAELKAKLG